MARILIAGCGELGTHLGQRLSRAGHRVWGLKRHPETLPPDINPLAADLTQPDSLTGLPANLDIICYTAAAGGYSEARYRAAYVDGVTNLLQALSSQDQLPRRFLFTSSTSVYAQQHGEWIDEESPAEPTGFSGRLIREGEEQLWNSSLAATVVRFGGIYGPGRTRLIDSVRQGTATCVENPPVYTNRIHRDDCARVLEHLITLPDPLPLYLGVDDEPAPQCQVLRWLARQLGVSGPTVVEADATPESRMHTNKRCRNQRLRTSGFRLRYPSYREGYGALLKAMG